MDIALIDNTNQLSETHRKLVKDILDFAGTYLKLPAETEMSVTFMDNAEIQKYNFEYRGVNKPTDVISFAIEEEDDEELALVFDAQMQADLGRNIGDILISIEKVAEQATYLGHTFERELGFLAVHGFLHLNGYDHMEASEEQEMFTLQREILDAFGLER
ncbi:rRNA maturation RNase YbeY [Periweissella beninensis]|uniref:Endoribonuclease YbeY n=1 Tax=Periweissella beninensis TaxID=504936 RepID=A0ABT0VLC5_9LACO|nr:rRNA maturation RNase YbeY [Periweissella beninensis]MBM7544975.1 putative rRNA maturation factor [Periweissella beninensis]MCM2437227.1 rRNA maturation RNase YbeY [Periweissella beninensis]MCT4395754.1 rRNA maturation RNase YbeY [Periweissella beninensis]